MTAEEHFKRWKPHAHWLTARENEVVKLVMMGLSNKEIGTRLGISSTTVETHRYHIYRKAWPKRKHWASPMVLAKHFWLLFAEELRDL